MKKPFLLKLLIGLIFFQSVSGLVGGIGLTISPSGEAVQMPLSMLDNTPFKNFLIPGLFLLLVLGIYPLLLAFMMLKYPDWEGTNRFNIYKKYHFFWTYSLFLGFLLILWIDIQIFLVGGGNILQFIYGILGALIVMLTISPPVMSYYENRS